MNITLNQEVKAVFNTGATFTGKVVDVSESGKVIYIENESKDDYLQVDMENPRVQVVDITPAPAQTLDEELEAWLDANDYDFDGYTNDADVDYSITGYNYIVHVHLDMTYGQHQLETTHLARYERENDSDDPYADTEKASGNRVVRKTLKGIKSYIDKWAQA